MSERGGGGSHKPLPPPPITITRTEVSALPLLALIHQRPRRRILGSWARRCSLKGTPLLIKQGGRENPTSGRPVRGAPPYSHSILASGDEFRMNLGLREASRAGLK